VPTIATEDVRHHVFWDAFRRYWALILLCALALAAAGYAFASRQQNSYVSSTRVLLRPTVGNSFNPDSTTSATQIAVAMDTEATLVDSKAVAALSNPTLRPRWVPGSGTVTATVPSNTQTLKITFKASSARHARAGARSVASSYLTWRHNQSRASIAASAKVLHSQIAALSAKLTAALRHSAKATTSTVIQQIQVMTGQLVSLKNTLSQLQATDIAPGSIISRATLPSKAAGVGSAVIIGAGAVLGLLLGILLAVARTRGDKRVRRTSTAVGNAPVLAVLAGRRPRSSRRGVDRDARVAYQGLRLSVLAAVPPGNAVAFSALSEHIDVGEIATELALSFNRAAYRVTVVMAADSAAGDLSGKPGLSELLAGAAAARDVLLTRDGVQILPPGHNLDGIQERLSSASFTAVLSQLASNCDYVIVVAPPTTTPTGLAVAHAAKAAILVGEERRTTSVQIQEFIERAEFLGVRIVGVVLRTRVRRLFRRRSRASAARSDPETTPSTGGAHTPAANPFGRAPGSAGEVNLNEGTDLSSSARGGKPLPVRAPAGPRSTFRGE
jgi:Mrp family chromosome partitioning ATPase